MDQTRRGFLYKMALLSIACSKTPDVLGAPINDDIDWSLIKSNYLVDNYPIMNLNSGSAGVMSKSTLDKHIEYLRLINSYAPYEILNQWESEIKSNLHRVSHIINATNGHLHLFRNSTEALNVILWGIQWKKKDQIIYATCDYPLLTNTLLQLQNTKKVKLAIVDHGMLRDISDDDIVRNYEKKITKRTRLLIVTHITHREGHILPVKRICDMAHSHGVEVLVDSAHAIGQIAHNVDDIGCDYYTSSLHKWLNAPLGSGMLYINDNHQSELYPPLSYPTDKKDSVVKYKYLGTRAFQNGITLGHAIDDLYNIGLSNKQTRLYDLKKYWTDRINAETNLEIITDTDRSCAIASVRVPKRREVYKELIDNHSIHVKMSGYKGDGFLRVSPNIFTLRSDLDTFVAALKDATL